MLRFGAILCLATVVLAQQGGDRNPFGGFGDRFNEHHQQNNDVIDQLHGFRFVEHQTDDAWLMIAIHDEPQTYNSTCYVLSVDRSWEPMLHNQTQMQQIVEDVWRLLQSDSARDTPLYTDQFMQMFHDRTGAHECTLHDKFLITYRPGGAPGATSQPVRPIG